MDREQILGMAEDQKWKLFKEDKVQCLLRIVREESMMDIWYGRMTVGVYPMGKPATYYRRVTESKLDQLLSEN